MSVTIACSKNRIPSLDEVKQYAHTHSYVSDPVRFFQYYDKRHWKLKGKLIENWQTLYDKVEANYKAEHGQVIEPIRPEYITRIAETEAEHDTLTAEERNALITELNRLIAINQKEIEEHQALHRKG